MHQLRIKNQLLQQEPPYADCAYQLTFFKILIITPMNREIIRAHRPLCHTLFQGCLHETKIISVWEMFFPYLLWFQTSLLFITNKSINEDCLKSLQWVLCEIFLCKVQMREQPPLSWHIWEIFRIEANIYAICYQWVGILWSF